MRKKERQETGAGCAYLAATAGLTAHALVAVAGATANALREAQEKLEAL